MFRATSIFALLLLALALSSLSLGGHTDLDHPPPNLAATLQDAQSTAAALAHAAIPGNDEYALTAALRLQTDTPIAHVARTTPLDRHVGDIDQFNLARIKEKDNIPISATVRLVTDHAYWYVQNGLDVNLGYLRDSATNFEDHIYPTNHQYFGSEWSPGVDGDPHITILTANIPGVGGYFSSADEYVRQVNQYSNEREMIYIAVKPEAMPGPFNYFEGVLAHEFQHMIHWNVQRNRDIWIDEGCAETAMALNNYDVGGADIAFRDNPDVQLTGWSPQPERVHYGAAFLFIRYMMAHYGGADFLKALMASPGTGPEAISGALQRQGSALGFPDVFKDWVVANYVNDPAVGAGRYAYPALTGHVTLDKRVIRYPATVNGDVHQYGADYVSLERGGGDTVIDFQGAPTAPLITTQPHSGHRFWYSNRRDSADTTLTHSFDLTRVPHATLDFWTWYMIEGDFDYGYTEVSTDGGKTWTTQKTDHTTDTNPNGANYGHGYTGHSGHDPKSTAPASWVHEQIDLTPYAGHTVRVRFEYITDEGFNDPSWAIDDISIPEIGYQTDAETDDGGWQAAGWARVANVVPQGWFVAALEYGNGAHDVKIETLAVDERGHGTLTIPGLGSSVHQAVLVIAALAPATTEVAPYRVQLQRTR
ncbi:MAG TPA: hypothetical protein VKY74_10805 [Chloroflexia bacterium]|nr:hypothetical protein [Chloroflexia bacterium]